MHLKWVAALCAASLLAACSGSSQGSSALPGSPGMGSSNAKRPHEKAKIVLRIKVPKKRVERPGRRPRFISPSTQSMKLIITNTGFNLGEVVNLTPTSTGCTSTLTSTLCQLTVSLAPANNYNATVTTYDQTGANGSELSTAQNISFNVVAGQANTINMTLSGVPAQIIALPASGASTSNVTGGIDLIGTASSKLLAEALDADGNLILGAGSPTYSVSRTSGAFNVTLTQPTATSPNTFYVQPPSAFTSGTATLTITASYQGQATDGCAQSGAVCSASFTVDMQELIGVASATSIDVIEPSTGTVIATVTPPGFANAIAFDSAANLYVSNCGTNCGSTGGDSVLQYAPPYSGTPVAITLAGVTGSTAVIHPEGLAFDSSGKLYVANDGVLVLGPTDSVSVYTPPFTAASTVTKVYTNTVNQPGALAIDGANDLFVADLTGNSGNGEVIGFTSAYSAGPPTYGPITSGVQGPVGIALDASANLYVASPTANHVTKYFGYNAVSGPGPAYTCTNNCGGSIGTNPKTLTNCGGCVGGTYTPVAVTALATSGNIPLGYAIFVADKQNNAVYEYSGATSPGFTRSITSNVSTPESLLLDTSSNLYVGNNTGNSVTEYTQPNYPFGGTLLSNFTAPIALAIVP